MIEILIVEGVCFIGFHLFKKLLEAGNKLLGADNYFTVQEHQSLTRSLLFYRKFRRVPF
jgi:UDP-glucose 4-epimerase